MTAPAPQVGEAPRAVVLVHGIGMSHRCFARLERLLSRTVPVITVDLPGFGRAKSPRRRLGIEGLAAALGAALDRLGITECDVVGHSMGTQVAVELARGRGRDRAAVRVESVVLIGPVVDDQRPTLTRQLGALLRDVMVESPRMNAIVLSDYLRSMPQYLRELRPMRDYPMLTRVAELTVPVLVMRGSRDVVARHDWATRVTDAARHGRLAEPQGPHHAQDHSPESVATAIAGFLGADAGERQR